MRWPYFRVEVEGESMIPTYLPGDRLLVRRHGRRLRGGDVVVFAHPSDDERLVVNRVVDVKRPDQPVVAGDNPARGTGSRDDMALDRRLVLGRVVARLSAVDRPSRRSYS
ncbi:MAG: S26 family signal peptidase [Acidimicrobiales bacterium]